MSTIDKIIENEVCFVNLSDYDSDELGECIAFACGYPIYQLDIENYQGGY